jgi:hypothetical protein
MKPTHPEEYSQKLLSTKKTKLTLGTTGSLENSLSDNSNELGSFEEVKKSPKESDLEKEHKSLKLVTFGLGGCLVAYTWSLMGVQIDIFLEYYQGLDYPFYSAMPAYLQIPFALLLTNFLKQKNISRKNRMLFLCITFTTVFCMIPVVADNMKHGKSSKIQF